VRATLANGASAARLGAAYLRSAPAMADVAALVAAIRRDCPDLEAVAASTNRDQVLGAVREWVGRDFAQGAVVSVGGWVLARTEARLAALAALV
jgi:hypothetical protein